MREQPLDQLRFEVRSWSGEWEEYEIDPPVQARDDFEVQVFVNEVELTSQGADLGMDPYDVLVPENSFVATPDPHVAKFARCGGCGTYGCGVTDIRITRQADRVQWEWEGEAPLDRPALFDAAHYDEVVNSIDMSWETPVRIVGRQVWTTEPMLNLQTHGLRMCWVANDYRDPELFTVSLVHEQSQHQIFVRFPWESRLPDQMAEYVLAGLRRHPSEWNGTWFAQSEAAVNPPEFVTLDWQPERGG